MKLSNRVFDTADLDDDGDNSKPAWLGQVEKVEEVYDPVEKERVKMVTVWWMTGKWTGASIACDTLILNHLFLVYNYLLITKI